MRDKIASYLWVDEKNACYDRDCDNRIMDVLTHNNLRCMYYGSFSQDMADRFVKYHLLNPDEFWTNVPLPSIPVNDPCFTNINFNNWGGQPQGLTYQRAIQALQNYGHEAEVRLIGRKWLELLRDKKKLVQQYDPFDGTPCVTRSEGLAPAGEETERYLGVATLGPDGYGPTILAALEYIALMSGVVIAMDRITWSAAADWPGCAYTQKMFGRRYTVLTGADGMAASIDGNEVFRCSARRAGDDGHGGRDPGRHRHRRAGNRADADRARADLPFRHRAQPGARDPGRPASGDRPRPVRLPLPEALSGGEGGAFMEYPHSVERWGVFEVRISGPSEGNPFVERAVAAVFTSRNETARVDGFYDGEGRYAVRFIPSFEEPYRFLLEADWLDGTPGGSFLVTPPRMGNRGPVYVANTFHFAYADGAPFYPAGTTCYAWTYQPDGIKAGTLETLRRGYFNKLRFCVFPKHYDFNFRDPAVFPYEGVPCDNSGITHENFESYTPRTPGNRWDFFRPNPAYFQNIEACVRALMNLGIQADLILLHPYDRWGFFPDAPGGGRPVRPVRRRALRRLPERVVEPRQRVRPDGGEDGRGLGAHRANPVRPGPLPAPQVHSQLLQPVRLQPSLDHPCEHPAAGGLQVRGADRRVPAALQKAGGDRRERLRGAICRWPGATSARRRWCAGSGKPPCAAATPPTERLT